MEKDPPLNPVQAMRALSACYGQQWSELMTSSGILIPFINSLGLAVILAWIVGVNGNGLATTYVLVGAALMQTWSWTVWRTGSSIADEHNAGTLELMMTARVPLLLVMLGKSLAILTLMAVSGLLVFITIYLSAHDLHPVGLPVGLGVSVFLAVMAVIVTSLIFAPFTFLLGNRSGVFNAILPFGAVASGFLFPIQLLPVWLRVFSYALPTS